MTGYVSTYLQVYFLHFLQRYCCCSAIIAALINVCVVVSTAVTVARRRRQRRRHHCVSVLAYFHTSHFISFFHVLHTTPSACQYPLYFSVYTPQSLCALHQHLHTPIRLFREDSYCGSFLLRHAA